MDNKEYHEKMEDKLKDETTYNRIEKDPTIEIKDEITQHLRDMKEGVEIDNKLYLRLLPRKTQIPRMYGLPKSTKKITPCEKLSMEMEASLKIYTSTYPV